MLASCGRSHGWRTVMSLPYGVAILAGNDWSLFQVLNHSKTEW